jgi:pimeloyl-ACP methyl ester carboxylesterase
MAIRVQRPSRVRRQVLRRLPKRFRPVPRFAIAMLVLSTALAAVLAGIRLSAPVGPLLPSGPLFGMGALERRAVELVAPAFWLYPDRIPAEEGWLTVPGDHRQDGGARLRVHYTRLEALVPEPDAAAAARAADPRSASPIVYLADAGRGSGTSALVGPDFAALQALRRHGPVIAFDARDSAHADPALYCPGRWQLPDDAPLSLAMLSDALRERVQQCAQALRQAHAGIRFGPEQSVADLEALRQALDLERIRLVAAGDGGRLALGYLQAHPRRVERAVLLAPRLPERAAPRPEHVENAVARALAALHADPYWGPRLPEPRESLRVAIARLDVQPAVATTRDPVDGGRVQVTLGSGDLRLAVLDHLGRDDGLQQLALLLSDVFDQRYQRLARTAVALRRAAPPRAALLARRCTIEEDPAAARRERMTAAFTLLGDAADLVRQAWCQAWPATPRGPDWSPPVSPPPVLLVAGEYDPWAPAEQVEELARALGGAPVLRASDSAPAAQLDWALRAPLAEHSQVLAFLDAPAPQPPEVAQAVSGAGPDGAATAPITALTGAAARGVLPAADLAGATAPL